MYDNKYTVSKDTRFLWKISMNEEVNNHHNNKLFHSGFFLMPITIETW